MLPWLLDLNAFVKTLLRKKKLSKQATVRLRENQINKSFNLKHVRIITIKTITNITQYEVDFSFV